MSRKRRACACTLRVVDQAAARRQPLDHDVLADREARNKIALLMHRADAGGDRLARRREADLFAVDQEAAFVRPIKAGHDLDQRRLAGAILADKSVNLPRPDFQRDAVQRDDAREALAHILDSETASRSRRSVRGRREAD